MRHDYLWGFQDTDRQLRLDPKVRGITFVFPRDIRVEHVMGPRTAVGSLLRIVVHQGCDSRDQSLKPM